MIKQFTFQYVQLNSSLFYVTICESSFLYVPIIIITITTHTLRVYSMLEARLSWTTEKIYLPASGKVVIKTRARPCVVSVCVYINTWTHGSNMFQVERYRYDRKTIGRLITVTPIWCDVELWNFTKVNSMKLSRGDLTCPCQQMLKINLHKRSVVVREFLRSQP